MHYRKYCFTSHSDDFQSKSVEFINKIVRDVKETKEQGLRYHLLDISTLRIAAKSSFSFVNNEDQSLQLGYIINLADDPGLKIILSLQRYKSKGGAILVRKQTLLLLQTFLTISTLSATSYCGLGIAESR